MGLPKHLAYRPKVATRDSWGDILAFWFACIAGGSAVGIVSGILLR